MPDAAPLVLVVARAVRGTPSSAATSMRSPARVRGAPPASAEDSRAARAAACRGVEGEGERGPDLAAGSSPRVSIACASCARSEENVTSSRTPVSTEYVATAARSLSPRPSGRTPGRPAGPRRRSWAARRRSRRGSGSGGAPPAERRAAPGRRPRRRGRSRRTREVWGRPSSRSVKSAGVRPADGLAGRDRDPHGNLDERDVRGLADRSD